MSGGEIFLGTPAAVAPTASTAQLTTVKTTTKLAVTPPRPCTPCTDKRTSDRRTSRLIRRKTHPFGLVASTLAHSEDTR
jgi:hypothetical protein